MPISPRKKPALSWVCEVSAMNDPIVVRIPASLTDGLLRFAAEQELSVEEIVETAMRNYMEGRLCNGRCWWFHAVVIVRVATMPKSGIGC